MRALFGCLLAPLWIPWIALSIVVRWCASRIFDPSAFRRLTEGTRFDYVGRWASGDYIGTRGMFGVKIIESDAPLVIVTIYYSRFQPFRRGETIAREFRAASHFVDIPVATQLGASQLFSYLEDEQLLWIDWPSEEEISREGKFHTLRPQSCGTWSVTETRKLE